MLAASASVSNLFISFNTTERRLHATSLKMKAEQLQFHSHTLVKFNSHCVKSMNLTLFLECRTKVRRFFSGVGAVNISGVNPDWLLCCERHTSYPDILGDPDPETCAFCLLK